MYVEPVSEGLFDTHVFAVDGDRMRPLACAGAQRSGEMSVTRARDVATGSEIAVVVRLRSQESRAAELGRANGLTPREIEILTMAASGARDAEIACRLHISPRTVAGHLGNAYAKLQVSGRVAAFARLGLVRGAAGL